MADVLDLQPGADEMGEFDDSVDGMQPFVLIYRSGRVKFLCRRRLASQIVGDTAQRPWFPGSERSQNSTYNMNV